MARRVGARRDGIPQAPVRTGRTLIVVTGSQASGLLAADGLPGQEQEIAMRSKRAFSLIEVLVVVSIIALLVSITMPSFREARRVSRKTVCKKNLASIGLGIHEYLMTNRDVFPWVCRLPSYEPTASQDAVPPREPYVSLPKALQTEIRGKSEVFLCPADKNTKLKQDAYNPSAYYIPTDRYYENEGLSYEWETKLNGLHVSFKEMTYLNGALLLKPSSYRMLADFEPFHGGSEMLGSWNVLFVDLHVMSDTKQVVPGATGINW
jgi:prepilin-type N-terminal cleavage/methylation domain-containing protein